MKKKIGIIGSGMVGQALAPGFLKHGYEVKLGTRNPDRLKDWSQSDGKGVEIVSLQDAAVFGDILVLAVKGNVAKNALTIAGESNFDGKTIIDACNPIDNGQNEDGVLKFFTAQNTSLMEELQALFPKANFVKAFNSVGSAFMVDPQFESKPTMFIGGDNENAKSEVKEILDEFGWETEDMGTAKAARAIEPLCILWCIPGFRENRWTHAFKLLKF